MRKSATGTKASCRKKKEVRQSGEGHSDGCTSLRRFILKKNVVRTETRKMGCQSGRIERVNWKKMWNLCGMNTERRIVISKA